jgi:hypothetical protein
MFTRIIARRFASEPLFNQHNRFLQRTKQFISNYKPATCIVYDDKENKELGDYLKHHTMNNEIKKYMEFATRHQGKELYDSLDYYLLRNNGVAFGSLFVVTQ